MASKDAGVADFLSCVGKSQPAARKKRTVSCTCPFYLLDGGGVGMCAPDPATAISTLTWLHRHDLFGGTISAIGAGVLVSRRRALNQIAASRSWTAALPV